MAPTVRLRFEGDSRDAESAARRVSDSVDDMSHNFSAKSAAMGAAGAAAGAALIAGFTDSMDTQDAFAKLSAQMGGSGTEAAKQAGTVAGKVYAGAYGENLGQVNEAVRAVMTSGAVMAGASNEQIQGVTQNVLSLAQAFDQDVQGSVNAVSQMMKTGLAKNADEALDILTAGLQNGADKAGDLLDTFNEYGTQFRKVGLDGKTAMGLISQGLKGGARDADLVADAIKEFSIRAVEGGADVSKAYKTMGLDAKRMQDDVAAGGPRAAAALDLTLDKLRDIKDPAERAGLAVALFGTQAEDMGDALYSLDVSSAVTQLGNVDGAAQKVNDTLGETAGAKLEATKRGFEDWKNSLIGVQGPLGDIAATVFSFGGDAIGLASNIGIAALAFKGLVPEGLLGRIRGVGGAVDEVGAAGGRAASGGIGRFASLLKFAGVAAGIYIIGSAIDDVNVKAAGGAENLQGQAKELHGFFQLLHGDLDFNTELTKTQTQWDETVENFRSGRAPIVEMFNNVGQSASNIFGAMGKAMKGDFAGAIADIKANTVTIPGVASAAGNQAGNGLSAGIRRANGAMDEVRANIQRQISVNVLFNAVTSGVSRAIQNIRNSIPKFHDGGVVGGAPGSETLALLKAGETVIPPGFNMAKMSLPSNPGSGSTGVSVSFSGNTSDAVSSMIMGLIRSGSIQIKASQLVS